MADNIQLSTNVGTGDVLAADDVGGVKYPVGKVAFGALDSATIVSIADGLPIQGEGTAGTPAGGVVSIQGVASGTAVPVSLSTIAVTNAGTFATQAAQSGTWNITNVSGTVSLPTGASTAAKQPALGTAGAASTDVITVQGIAAMTALKVDGSAVTQPVSGTVTANLAAGTNNIGDVDVLTLPALVAGTANIGDVDVLTVPAPLSTAGGGLEATALRVTLASDSTGLVSVDDNGGALTVDNAGTFAVQAAQAGTWTVQPGNTANTTAWLVNDAPATSGGLSKFHLVSAATTNANNVKASAGQVYCITAFNLNAAARYLKFHNTAGAPTAGTGVTDTFLIPGNTAGTGVVINIDKGIAFSTGIGITIVAGIADADATAVAASEIVVQVYFK